MSVSFVFDTEWIDNLFGVSLLFLSLLLFVRLEALAGVCSLSYPLRLPPLLLAKLVTLMFYLVTLCGCGVSLISGMRDDPTTSIYSDASGLPLTQMNYDFP
jgi:hypothetical protein